MAQRLSRKLCQHCKQSYTPTDDELSLIRGAYDPSKYPEHIVMYKAKGCKFCNHLGYSGRSGLFEVLKMSNENAQGQTITFSGLPPGGWFGEGTVIKREVYRYNIKAVRRSLVAGLSVSTFHWLLDRSIPFNRFIIQQLNERLGQFIGARETDRMINVDARVARSLGALFHPVLYPGVAGLLRITQQELGYLIGLSRQRVNEALNVLQDRGLIRIEYGGVRVLDLDGLRRVG